MSATSSSSPSSSSSHHQIGPHSNPVAEKFRLPSSEIVLPGEDLVFCFVLSISLKLVLKFFINNDCKAFLKKQNALPCGAIKNTKIGPRPFSKLFLQF